MMTFLSEKYVKYRSSDRIWLSIAILAGCAVMLPMLFLGVPEGYDLGDHLLFAAAYRDALLDGDITASWAAVSNFGFGSIGVRFYPPVADLLTGAVNLVTNDWYNSLLITFFFWMIPGCVGMYLWASEYVDPPKSALAAAIFAVMPYHLFEIYQFTLLSEFAAASILPFCFLFVTRLVNRGSAMDVLLFAVAYSLLVLTHIPTTVTGSLALGVYTVILLDRGRVAAVIGRLAAAAVISLAATSFFWMKMVTELDWVAHHSDQHAAGSQAFSFHLFPIFLTAPAEFYRLKMMWMLDSSTILTILVIAPIFIYFGLFVRKTGVDSRRQKLVSALAGTGLFLILIMSVPSKFVWAYAPVLSKIQFPWRFLSPASVIAAMTFAVAVPSLYLQFPKLRRGLAYSVVVTLAGVLVFNAVENVIASAPYSRTLFQKEYGDLAAVNSCDCWLPTWANEKVFFRTEKVAAGERSVEITEWDGLSRKFTIGGGDSENARIATLWYPHWQAEINGRSAELDRDPDGAILIPLEPGPADVHLFFSEPRYVGLSESISGAAWVGIFGGIVFLYRRQSRDAARLATLN